MPIYTSAILRVLRFTYIDDQFYFRKKSSFAYKSDAYNISLNEAICSRLLHSPYIFWYPRWDSNPQNSAFETDTYTNSVTWAFIYGYDTYSPLKYGKSVVGYSPK